MKHLRRLRLYWIHTFQNRLTKRKILVTIILTEKMQNGRTHLAAEKSSPYGDCEGRTNFCKRK